MISSVLSSFIDALPVEISRTINKLCAGQGNSDDAVVAAVANRIRVKRGLPVTEKFQRRWDGLNGLGETARIINDLLKPLDDGIEAMAAQAGRAGVLGDWGVAFNGYANGHDADWTPPDAEAPEKPEEAEQAGATDAGEAGVGSADEAPQQEHPRPAFDARAMAAFLNMLLELRDKVTLSALNGKAPKKGDARRYQELRKTGVMETVFLMTLDSGVADALKWALQWNAKEGWNLYWQALEDGVPVALWCDYDTEEAAQEALPNFCRVWGVEPYQVHVVHTGTLPFPRYQLLVAPVVMPSEPVARAKAAAHLTRADVTVYDQARLLRLPGSIAWPFKNGRFLLTRIAETVMWTPAIERPFILNAPEPFVEPKPQLGAAGQRRTFSGASPETARKFHELIKRYEILTGEGRGRRKPWLAYYGLLLELGAPEGEAESMWIEVCNNTASADQIGEAIKWVEKSAGRAERGETVIGYGTFAFYLRQENLTSEERAFIDKLGQPSVDWEEAMKGAAEGTSGAGQGASEERDPFKNAEADPFKNAGKPRKVDDLMAKEIPELKFAVPDYLPAGVQLLVAAPKIGKSWLALLITLAVAEGSDFWGRKCEPGDVLYLALEDGERRLQNRIRALRPDGSTGFSRIAFFLDGEVPRVAPEGQPGGLIPMLRNWLTQHPGRRLVVIDVLTCIRPEVTDKKKQLYETDYQSLTALRQLAAEFSVLILVIHHTRKSIGEDVLDRVSGSTGLTGSSDGILIVERDGAGTDPLEGEKQPHRIKITSRARDVRDFVIRMRREGDSPAWIYVPPGEDVGLRMADGAAVRAEIIEALMRTGRPMKWVEIADAIGRKKTVLFQHLTALMREGLVKRLAHGEYVHASYDPVAAAKDRLKTLTVDREGGPTGFKVGHIVGVGKDLLEKGRWGSGLPHDISGHAWCVAIDAAHDAIGKSMASALVERKLWLKAGGAYWMTTDFDLLNENIAFTV